jgi:hypothetical protein
MEKGMDRRKELKEQYKQRTIVMGVFQIKNTVNGRVFLGSSLNMHGMLDRHKFQLTMNSHVCEDLQKDWKAMGESAFLFEVLETLETRDDAPPDYDYGEDLAILEQIWIDKLNVFGGNGYNKSRKIRF